MGSTANIYTLIRLYGKKQHRTFISVEEFSSYLRKYAQHYVNEQPELEKYTKTPLEPLLSEISKLVDENKIVLKEENGEKVIGIASFFTESIFERYKNMATMPSTPFPMPSNLPADFPKELIGSEEATIVLYDLFDGKPHNDNLIYALVFRREISPILVPNDVTPDFLLKAAMAKLRLLLQHSEQHDYFLQKVMSSNGGREMQVKTFFKVFMNDEDRSVEKLKEAGDSYYFWNQLILFLRQDLEKIKDRTSEDIDLLHAVYIIEVCVAYFRNKNQIDLQKETALHNLELAFEKQPYYFDSSAIAGFADTRGVPLLGQYSEDDLNDFLRSATSPKQDGQLPKLLTFKTEDDNRYFVLQDKVMPLVMKLCTESRKVVHDELTKKWFDAMQHFQSIPAMKNMKAFNDEIEDSVKRNSPILHTLLNSPFLLTIYYEALDNRSTNVNKFNFFADGKLLPYNELLMLSQHTIMTDAKILLPIWYTIPGLSWIIALFTGTKKKPKSKSLTVESKKKNAAAENDGSKSKGKSSGGSTAKIAVDSGSNVEFSGTKKEQIKEAVKAIEKQIVPPDSSLDSELTSYLNEWNHLIDKQAKKNLTEDVNSLIRDYLRKILRTATPKDFTLERVRSLAETLVNTPAMQKIGEIDSLQMYVQLYMLRLIKKA